MPNPIAKTRTLNLIQLNLAVFLFGFTGLFGKWLTVSPWVIVFGRVTFAFAALSVFILLTRQSVRLKNAKHAGILLLLALLFMLHWAAFFGSIQVSSIAVCLVSFSTAPIFTVLLEPVFYAKHKLKPEDFVLACIVTLGVFIANPSWSLNDSATKGVLLGIGAGLTIAIVTLINRSIVAHYPAFVIVFYLTGTMMVVLAPVMLMMQPAVTVKDVGLLATLGIVFTAFAQMLFVQSMETVPARLASLINTGMEVVYGITFGAIILHEIPNWRTVVGGAIIVGTTLYATSRHNANELLVDPV